MQPVYQNTLKIAWRLGNEKKINVVASHTYDVYSSPHVFVPTEEAFHVGEFCLLFTNKLVSLWGLEIYEPHRKKGYAKKLLRALIWALKQQNRHTLALYVKPGNEAAIKLYEQLGFKYIPQNDSNSLYYELDLLNPIVPGNLPHYNGEKEITF